NLPWNLVFIGGALAAVIESVGLPSLAFAVGLYLPITLTTPIVAGGLIRGGVENWYEDESDELRDHREQGVLYSSGLIAGAALVGVIAAALIALSQLEGANVAGWLAAVGSGAGALLSWMQGVGGAVVLPARPEREIEHVPARVDGDLAQVEPDDVDYV
ncbi:MAG: OPT/YSL family transporter, partial [Bradymonadaceae bacterium]